MGRGLLVNHVNALLRQLGVDVKTLKVPAKINVNFRRGELQRTVMRELRSGPKTSLDVRDATLLQR